MTYEDLHREPHEGFRSLVRFVGVEIGDRLLERAIEASSFERMKAMEKRGSMREPWMRRGAGNFDKALKVRKGKVGSYRQELSADDVAYLDRVINARLDPKLPYGTGG